MGQYLDSRPLPGGHYLAGLAGCPRGTAQEVRGWKRVPKAANRMFVICCVGAEGWFTAAVAWFVCWVTSIGYDMYVFCLVLIG